MQFNILEKHFGPQMDPMLEQPMFAYGHEGYTCVQDSYQTELDGTIKHWELIQVVMLFM